MVLVIEGMKGSWRAADRWHCEKAEEAIGKVATSLVVEGPGLKVISKDIEAWHH